MPPIVFLERIQGMVNPFTLCYHQILFMDEEYLLGDFDVLLTDVTSVHLHHEISQKMKKAYLSDFHQNDRILALHGVIWGPHSRIFVPGVVRIKQVKKWVYFLLDTGSPKTYLAEEVFSAFNRVLSDPTVPVSVHLNGFTTLVYQSPQQSHFSDVNLLGADFLKTLNAKVCIDYQDDLVTIELCEE